MFTTKKIYWQRKEALKSAPLSSDENLLKIWNLSGVAKKPATYVMSLWLGMMVVCNAFPEK